MSGKKIAYIRVSSKDQNTDRQEDLIAECDKAFTDKCTGSTKKRPELEKLINYVREGDTVYAHSIDRLARNLKDLQELIDLFNEKGVSVVFKKESLTFSAGGNDSMSKLMLQIFGAVAEFERARIKERQREGIDKALTRKVSPYKGRKADYTPDMIANALSKSNGNRERAAKFLGCGVATIYRHIAEQKKKQESDNQQSLSV